MSPATKKFLYTSAGSVLCVAAGLLLTQLAKLPSLAPVSAALAALGGALLGKEHLAQSAP